MNAPVESSVNYAAYVAAGAALMAAAVSFVASYLSNRNTRRQVAMQLQHAAEQRERERAMTLKRDVYIPAMEAITRMSSMVVQAAGSKTNVSELSEQFIANMATLSKIDVVASEVTV